MVMAEQCWHKSLSPLMKVVRNEFKDVPTYISFDIDAIDPGYCPGTGTWSVNMTWCAWDGQTQPLHNIYFLTANITTSGHL